MLLLKGEDVSYSSDQTSSGRRKKIIPSPLCGGGERMRSIRMLRSRLVLNSISFRVRRKKKKGGGEE